MPLKHTFITNTSVFMISSGISIPFETLFRIRRQIIHGLLTRPPLYSRSENRFRVRLACVKHAASVHSEPGSNSQLNILQLALSFLTSTPIFPI